MKIAVTDFIEDKGTEFTLTATTEAERVLLWACVDTNRGTFVHGEEENDFILILPVNN